MQTADCRDTATENLAERARRIRRFLVHMLIEAGGGHYGGCLSCVDIMAALYFGGLRIKPQHPRWDDRDRFILSKGHACATLVCTLAEAGYFPESSLASFNKLNSPYGMHPDMHKIPGCDMSTGSLGHGLSVGVGMAIAARLNGKKGVRVFVLLGDGEIQEGQVWEAAMAAAHYRLDNLVAIVDRNFYQLDGSTKEVMDIEPHEGKWKEFGWSVKVVDGHDVGQLKEAFESIPIEAGRPSVIIANTVKGYGVSRMENTHKWHYGVLTPDQEQEVMAEFDSRGI